MVFMDLVTASKEKEIRQKMKNYNKWRNSE